MSRTVGHFPRGDWTRSFPGLSVLNQAERNTREYAGGRVITLAERVEKVMQSGTSFPSLILWLSVKGGEKIKPLQNKITRNLAFTTDFNEKEVDKDFFSWSKITYHAKVYLYLTSAS